MCKYTVAVRFFGGWKISAKMGHVIEKKWSCKIGNQGNVLAKQTRGHDD